MFNYLTQSKCVLLAITLTLFSFQSLALSQVGHQAVCQLSFEHLSSSQQTNINNLLQNIPAKHKKIINTYTKSEEDSIITYSKACTWPDAIKLLKRPENSANLKESEELKRLHSFKSWHFLNIPRNTKKIENGACNENCIGQGILIHQQQLSTASDGWERVQALMFLGHWLGDIHQPLHVSYSDDLGGNRVKLTDNSQCKSLHAYWDSCIINAQNKSFSELISFLNQQWESNPVKPWHSDNVWEWANESYQILTAPTFKYCQKIKGRCESYEGIITLPKGYQAQYASIINTRLVLAAKRLTSILQASSL